MPPIKISALKDGQKFIWADQHTRHVMLVDVGNNYRSGIMETVWVNNGDIKFLDTWNEQTYTFGFTDDMYVYPVEDADDCIDISMDLTCVRCGNRYGAHWGMNCPSTTASGKKIFVPDQDRVEIKETDWLMEELGL